MSSRQRVASLAVLAIAALPVLSACNTSPGSAAIVGGDKITTGTLQSQVDAALADPTVVSAFKPGSQYAQALGTNRAGFVRQTLARLITDQVLAKVAAAHHVAVTAQDVKSQTASFVQQAGSLGALHTSAVDQGIGVSAAQMSVLIRTTVLQKKLGTALTANLTATPAQLAAEYQKDIDNFDQVDIAQIQLKTQAQANQVLAKARANPSTFPALAAQDSLDTTTKDKGGAVGLVPTSQVQQAVGSTPLKSGTFVIAKSSGSFIVLHIIKREVQPISAVTGQLKQSLFSAQAQTLIEKAVTAESRKLGVHVSPRYGKWDNATESVVVTADPTSATAPTRKPATAVSPAG